jgi:hypothetical protein
MGPRRPLLTWCACDRLNLGDPACRTLAYESTPDRCDDQVGHANPERGDPAVDGRLQEPLDRTYAPELTPDVLDRLADYVTGFRNDFNRPRQSARCGVYLRGLIQDGDRKSVEPMAARVPPPDVLNVSDPDQALQQLLGQSTWDEQAVLGRYRTTMAAEFADSAGVFVIDDTAFPKQGKHSVGLQRQYWGYHYQRSRNVR